MLVIIQFPIFDLRKFYDSEFQPLVSWNSILDKDINKEFIRSMGPLTSRKNGANSYGDEAVFAKSKNAIRFNSLPMISLTKEGVRKKKYIKPIFRRFYFDGDICSKYEIGFPLKLNKTDQLDQDIFLDFIKSLFTCSVTIPIPFKESKEIPLICAGESLSQQYRYASTPRKKCENSNLNGVFCGSICIYVDKKKSENFNPSLFKKSIFLKEYEANVSLYRVSLLNREIKLWLTESEFENSSREIRIAILKQNVFREAIQVVLKQIELNKLLPKYRSDESNALQEFLKGCFSNYFKNKSIDNNVTGVYDLVIQIEDKFGVINRIALENNLKKQIRIRGNYFNSTIRYLDSMENDNKASRIQNITIQATNVIYSERDIIQTINDSFNHIENANISKELSDLLKKITEETTSLIKSIADPEKQKSILDSLNGMSKEVSKAKKEPSGFLKFYNTFVDTLKTIGETGLPIINMVEKVLAFI